MDQAINPLVYAVILDANRCQDTVECLASLQQSDYPRLKILLLDNATTDGTVKTVREQFPGVEILELAENKGYAGNNNVGLARALDYQADWIFILNDDVSLSPDCLRRLIEVGEADPKAGVLGPLVYHHSEATVIQSAGGCLDEHWQPMHIGANQPDEGQYRTVREVDWVTGCSILVRRQALEQAGLMDERFFLYNEEVDFCYRIKQKGWKILLVPDAKLWHKGVQRDYRPSPNVSYYTVRNLFLFQEKSGAPLSARLYTWSSIIRRIISFSIRPRWKDKKAHRDAAFQALRDYLARRWGKREV